MAKVLLSGFGDNNANGLYSQNGNHDGFPYYEQDSGDYIIIYRLEYGPHSYSTGYWIEKTVTTNGSIKFYTPKYKATDTTDVETATWTSVVENTSGEETVGTLNDETSSSSSSSSIDSSSSSSVDSSSSSSSVDSSSSSSSSSEDVSESSSSS
jgi:hypothetical protein